MAASKVHHFLNLQHHAPFPGAIRLPRKPIRDFPPRSLRVLQHFALFVSPSSASLLLSPALTSSSTEGPNSVTVAGAVWGKLAFLSKPPPVKGLSGLFFLSRLKSAPSMVRVNFLLGPFLARGDLVGEGGGSAVCICIFLGDFFFGERGERETLDANSSILSLVLTLKESSESLMGTLSETSEDLRGLRLVALPMRKGDHRTRDSCVSEIDEVVPSVLSTMVIVCWMGESISKDDTELSQTEEERHGCRGTTQRSSRSSTTIVSTASPIDT